MYVWYCRQIYRISFLQFSAPKQLVSLHYIFFSHSLRFFFCLHWLRWSIIFWKFQSFDSLCVVRNKKKMIFNQLTLLLYWKLLKIFSYLSNVRLFRQWYWNLMENANVHILCCFTLTSFVKKKICFPSFTLNFIIHLMS